MLNFNSTIIDPINPITQKKSLIWGLSESYLHVIQSRYEILSLNDKTVCKCSTVTKNTDCVLTALKVCSYIVIIIPLIALVIKACYRYRYQFTEATQPNTKPPTPQKTDSETRKGGAALDKISSLSSSIKAPHRSSPSDGLQTLVVQTPTETSENITPQTLNPNRTKLDLTVDDKSQKPYCLQTVIDRVTSAKSRGLKIGLFLGRCNDQSIPKEEGWEWFSLDQRMNEKANQSSHLQMDFNALTKNISYIFNKVVCDFSTIKFFSTPPWATLYHLLTPEKDSVLITDESKGVVYYQSINEPIHSVKNGYYILPNKFAATRDYQTDIKRQFDVQSLAYLKTLFSGVELKQGPYPYRAEDNGPHKYWVLKGPILLSRKEQSAHRLDGIRYF